MLSIQDNTDLEYSQQYRKVHWIVPIYRFFVHLVSSPSRQTCRQQQSFRVCPLSSERSLDPINRASQTDGDFFWRARVRGRGRANGAEADKSPSILQQMAPRVISLAFRRGRRENGGWTTRISHTLIQKTKNCRKTFSVFAKQLPQRMTFITEGF